MGSVGVNIYLADANVLSKQAARHNYSTTTKQNEDFNSLWCMYMYVTLFIWSLVAPRLLDGFWQMRYIYNKFDIKW